MAKVVSLFFNKMFQTKREISMREKNIVLTIFFFLSILVIGYFMIS